MHDNDGLAVNIVAAGDIQKNDFVYDEATGWAGFALDTVSAGEGVALEIARGHRVKVPNTVAATVGMVLHVSDAGALAATGTRPFMKVTEVVEDVTTGFDLVTGVVLPQTWAKFAVA